MTACHLCGGFDYRHDPIAHGAEPTWTDCRTCNGDGSVIDGNFIDWTCPDCAGDGGWER